MKRLKDDRDYHFSEFLIVCIYFFTIKKSRHKKANKKINFFWSISDRFHMTGKEFENYLKSLFHEMGYSR